MKYLILISIFFSFKKANSQSSSLITVIGRTIILPMNIIPTDFYSDSCYYFNTLLKIDFDDSSKIKSVSLSDNAEKWLLEELIKYKPKMKFDKIEECAKKEQILSKSVVVPLIIRSTSFPCANKAFMDIITSKKYFLFDGLPPNNPLYFDAIDIPIGVSVR